MTRARPLAESVCKSDAMLRAAVRGQYCTQLIHFAIKWKSGSDKHSRYQTKRPHFDRLLLSF